MRDRRSPRRPGLVTNPRPVPWTTTMVAGGGRVDRSSRWATVVDEEQNAARQRAHGGNLVSSCQRVNNGNPVSSLRQAHRAVFSSNYRRRRQSNSLLATLSLFVGRCCNPVTTATDAGRLATGQMPETTCRSRFCQPSGPGRSLYWTCLPIITGIAK